MKRIVLAIIVVGLAVAAGFYFVRDPGTASISLLGWQLQTTALWLIVLVLALFVVLAFVLRLLVSLVRLPSWFRLRASRRGRHAADENLLRAWAERQRGRVTQAEKLALSGLDKGSVPPLHYVVAVDALLDQHQNKRALEMLEEVQRRFPRFADFLALHITRRMRSHGCSHEARYLLKDLAGRHPSDEAVVRAYAECMLTDRDWAGLTDVLPKLRRMNHLLLTESDLQRFERAVLVGRLTEAANRRDLDALSRCWAEAPRALAVDPEVTLAYGRLLVRLEQPRAAAELMEKWLKTRFDARLLSFWAELPHPSPDEAQAMLAGFLGSSAASGQEATAFRYARARLELLSGDLEEALRLLNPLLDEQPSIGVLRLAAEIHARMRDSNTAASLYEQALKRAETENLGTG